MEFDVQDNGNGSYTVTERYGDAGDGGTVMGIIAYVLAIIGMILGTIACAEIPYALVIMIILDVAIISPLILFPIAKIKKLSLRDMFRKALSLIGKYACIPFAISYVVIWILIFNKAQGPMFYTLFFFSMYGIYYFPYFMLRMARKHNSMALSVLTLVAIYSGLILMTIIALVTKSQEWLAMAYPLIFPSVMAVFSLIMLPASNIYYKHHVSRGKAMSILTFFKFLGGSIIVLAFILACYSSLK